MTEDEEGITRAIGMTIYDRLHEYFKEGHPNRDELIMNCLENALVLGLASLEGDVRTKTIVDRTAVNLQSKLNIIRKKQKELLEERIELP